jgi:phosphotriesterase-related protein
MKQLHLIGILVLAGFLYACDPSDSTPDRGKILTVTGAIDPSDLGTTLTHEHLLVDFIGADSTGYHRWNRDTVVRSVGPFLEEIKPLGVQSFVECTPAYLGRDPLLLKQLSEQTGMQILTNTGYYGARNNKFIPGKVFEMDAEALAALWTDEYRNGIDGTGIRPGFIKIGVDANDTLSDKHRLLIEAAALTHKVTGLVIASHTGPETPAFDQLDVLENHDVPASAFIWVHAQSGTQESNIRAAERGAWISLDNVNAARDNNPGARFSTAWYVERLSAMKEAGLLDRVLISHDAGWYRPGEPGGGTFRGFTDVFTTLVPALQERGFTGTEINQLLAVNPSKAFVIR